MKGVINKGIQELVESRFGAEAWERVKSRAGCTEPFFGTHQDYPDELTHALVAATAEVSGLSTEAVLEEFGRFWIPHTGRETYPTLFSLAGRGAREFLSHVDRLHDQVTRHMPGATPPRFDCEETPGGGLRLHYRSPRKLCPVLKGLIEGVAAHFGERVEVRKVTCMHRGDPQCTMEISFP